MRLISREQAFLDGIRRHAGEGFEVWLDIDRGEYHLVCRKTGGDIMIEVRNKFLVTLKKRYHEAYAALVSAGIIGPRHRDPSPENWRERRREYLESAGRDEQLEKEGLLF